MQVTSTQPLSMPENGFNVRELDNSICWLALEINICYVTTRSKMSSEYR